VIALGSVAPVNLRQLAMGISPAVDGLVDHPYSPHTVPEIVPWASTPSLVKRDGIASADEQGTFASQIRLYREQSAKHHGPGEIWLTEFGYTTFQPAKPGEFYSGFTPSAQAKWSVSQITSW